MLTSSIRKHLKNEDLITARNTYNEIKTHLLLDHIERMEGRETIMETR